MISWRPGRRRRPRGARGSTGDGPIPAGARAAVRRRAERRRRRIQPATPEQRRLRIALLAFLTVLLTGFVGYQVLSDATPLDALYMTVITITTVGFGEIVPLDSAGRVLTIGLIVAGVGSASYAAITAAEFVVEGHLRHVIERRRMEREIDALDGHIIVCGFGRVGRHLAAQLDRDGAGFVVVDADEGKVADCAALGYLHVQGDATEEDVLAEAGLARAGAVVACVNTDADNVLVTLTAKGLSPDTTIVARAKAEENEAKLRRAGAERVIAPSTIGGRRIAQILTRPALASFLEAAGTGGMEYLFEEVPVTAGSELEGASLRDAAVRERYGCTVLAIRRGAGGVLETHPSADDRFQAGDVLLVMGSEREVTGMRDRFRAV